MIVSSFRFHISIKEAVDKPGEIVKTEFEKGATF